MQQHRDFCWFVLPAEALWTHGQDWSQYKSAAVSFLPTEAQWEYAARGPKPAKFPWGDSDASEELLNVCWEISTYEGVSCLTLTTFVLRKCDFIAFHIRGTPCSTSWRIHGKPGYIFWIFQSPSGRCWCRLQVMLQLL